MGKIFYIKTFGCQMNERDSEIMGQLLTRSGYECGTVPEAADLILINTCSIRDKAEQKVYSLLGQLRDLKAKKKTVRIGVCGCVAQQEGHRILERMPHVDLVVGTRQFHQIPQLLTRLESGESQQAAALELGGDFPVFPFLQAAAETDRDLPSSVQRYINIMQGCNNFCSYCVVPYTRGREVSRPLAAIVEEARLLVAQGVREITLLGQNVNSYGKTNAVAPGPVTFPDLLRAVARIEGLRRLRFTTSHPKDLSEELMRCFAELDVLCPHFHLPVQSGSNRILVRMNRGYTADDYRAKVERLRRIRPDIALATDFIVGFPGETEADFQDTLQLLQEVRFHSSFSFKYSDRPQTRARSFADKIPEEMKGERLRRLQILQDAICLEWNNKMIGQKANVLVEHCDAAGGRGRSPANQVVHFRVESAQPLPGDCITVLVKQAGPHSLRGLMQQAPFDKNFDKKPRNAP